MNKQLLTLEDLVRFCNDNNFTKFSSKETGYKVVVQTPAYFEIDEENSNPGLLRLKLKVCHTGLNRNGSFISKENMTKAMPSLKNRPILAHIHQLDNGDWDFESHNREIIEEDGEQIINYIEKQVGSFTEDEPYLEYDEDNEKDYVVAYAVIPEAYTKTADIIRRKNGTKNSCEIHIDKFSYNAKEKRLEIEEFYFEGSTLLGCRKNGKEIAEGMAGSRADIAEFSQENNSILLNLQNENTIEPSDCSENNEGQADFNINNEKGGNSMLNELLNKYNKTIEDIKFEYENLSDEELSAKFEEVFGENNEGLEPDNGSGENFEGEDNSASDNAKPAAPIRNVVFELSFDEIRQAINTLCSIYRNDDEWCYVQTVYDSYFIMCDWDSDRFYKQSYVKDGDNISLSGERIELYPMFVTESEKIALEDLRSNYELIENELNAYKKKESDAEKEKIFADESYADYIGCDEFKALIESKDEYSVEELRDKAEIAFAKCVRKAGTFSLKNNPAPATAFTKHKLTATNTRENKPYGNIFDK